MEQPHPPEMEARIAAARAMRRLGNAMMAHEADEELLWRIARQADATAEIVEAEPRRQRPIAKLKRQMWETAPPDGGPMVHFEECMVSGRANPMGIAMKVRREGERVVADLNLGAAFEGAPQRAHGGAVAAVFDDIMGYVLLLRETPAFTGRLGVSYRAPTPVETPLLATAWMDRREGRKLFMAATLTTPDGDLIAEGDGVFIAIPPERFSDGDQ